LSLTTVFAPWGVVLVAALGLYLLALKLRSTFFAWVLAVLLGAIAAYCVEFLAEGGLLMATGKTPFRFEDLATYSTAAVAAIWVSGNAKASRWPIFGPCVIIASRALQHGIRLSETASTFAGAITLMVGAICWFLVPKTFTAPEQMEKRAP